jgi:hypothetical protein
MSKIVTMNLQEPCSAGNAELVLKGIPGMPEILKATVRGLQITVLLADTPTASMVSTIIAYGASLPLMSRIVKYTKIASEETGAAINGGLEFDATGTSYFYDTDMEAQLNILGAIVGQIDQYWHVRQFSESPKTPVLHTAAQLVALGTALSAWKGSRIMVFQIFKTAVGNATTTQEADAIFDNWDAQAALPVTP